MSGLVRCGGYTSLLTTSLRDALAKYYGTVWTRLEARVSVIREGLGMCFWWRIMLGVVEMVADL